MMGGLVYFGTSSISILLGLGIYILVTGQTHYFDPGIPLTRISPHIWAMIGIACCIGLSSVGAGWGIWIAGTSLIGGSINAPDIRTRNLISILFCEAAAIYGFILAILMSTKLSGLYIISRSNMFTGYSLFWGGLTVGLCDMICGISVGIIGSSTALGDAQNPSLFFKSLMMEVFATAVGLFGLVIGFLQVVKANPFSDIPIN
jgi:V-type H+-transporting ATPase 21kDa proteolipid subunit